ncbi:MAG: trimethylamine methyltransferase family protein, partial [Alphaproteobacteria bacterium]|nr:trimethylamine methyltransferase family protein [Alphaproteobacteria bacterium]
DLPSGVAAGMADSKIPDAQAGYEKAISAVAAGLAGANLIYEAAGMYASLLGCSFEGFVLDNEILGTALRVVRGIEVNPETADLGVIRDVVAGAGHFLGESQTVAAMRRDYYYPPLADRATPQLWDDGGGYDALARCRFRCRELLAEHYPSYVPGELEQRIRARHNILLPEDMMKPGDRWRSET